MTAAAIWTNLDSSGCAATDTREIRTDLGKSGQFWTNLNT